MWRDYFSTMSNPTPIPAERVKTAAEIAAQSGGEVMTGEFRVYAHIDWPPRLVLRVSPLPMDLPAWLREPLPLDDLAPG